MKAMRTLIVTDLYINAGFQMALNTLRRIGIRPTWLVMAVHVWALYYFLTFAVMCAIGEDLFGLLLGSVVATTLIGLLVRVFYESFLVIVGEGATVDEMRLKFQLNMTVNGNLWIARPVCLIGALVLIAVHTGVHQPMEPFLYGFLLLSTGMYLETCV
jgi:hypothetical protein